MAIPRTGPSSAGRARGCLDADVTRRAPACRRWCRTSQAMPNIDAGNMVYKNLAFMADAQTAGRRAVAD